MPIIGPRLRDHVDLTTGLRAILRIVQGTVDAILFDGVLRDLQTGLRFLRLLLNAAGVNTIERKIVIVTGAPGEADRSLIATAIILRERSKQRKTGPISTIVGKIRDLFRVDYGCRLGGNAVCNQIPAKVEGLGERTPKSAPRPPFRRRSIQRQKTE